MSDYRVGTKKTWEQTRRDLEECFRKWSVIDWNIIAEPKKSKLVSIRFVLRRKEVRLTMEQEWYAKDNLRRIYLALDDMRMIEVRGLGDVVQEAYLQLAAPCGHQKRDPYEVMGIREDAPPDLIEVVYKTLAKKLHPDTGGTAEAMAELNEAYEAVKGQ